FHVTGVQTCALPISLDQARRGRLEPEFARREAELARTARRRLDLARLVAGWAARYAEPEALLTAGRELGARLIIPGDTEWPTQLDDLADRRPFGLWLDGSANLRFTCLRSVSIVGSRA